MKNKLDMRKHGLYNGVGTATHIVYEYDKFLFPLTSSKLLVKNMLKDEFCELGKKIKSDDTVVSCNRNNKYVYLVPTSKRDEFIQEHKDTIRSESFLWLLDVPYEDKDSCAKYEFGYLV